MIELRRRPYELNWSGNPIVYELFDNDAIGNADMSFEVKLMFAPFEGALPLTQVAIFPLTPFQGKAKIDLSEVLGSKLSFFVPSNIASAFPVESTGAQSGSFYIEYRSVTPQTTNAAWNTSELDQLRCVFKGGIANFQWKNNNFFTTYLPTAKPFFTWQKRGRLASSSERIYLSWLNLNYVSVDTAMVQAKITVTYTDDSTASTIFSFTPLNKYFFYYVPAGIAQLALFTLQPAKTIWYWTVQLQDITNPSAPVNITEAFKFLLDNRNDYNQQTLHYRNSIGGLDAVRIRGVIETTINLEGNEAEQAASADWPYLTLLARMDVSLPHREIPVYKGDIGHLDKQEQDRLRDAFLNREVWMEKNGRWWPVKLLTKQYRQKSTSDKRYSLPFEWMLADSGSNYYTPEAIDMGAGIATTNVCSAVVNINNHLINFSAGNATVTFSYSVTGIPEKLQYKIPGYVNSWTDLPYVVSGNLVYTFPQGVQVTLFMRAVCTGNVPGNYRTYSVNTTQTPGSPNSNIYNQTLYGCSYTINRNGTQIAAGEIDGNGDYDSFYCLDGNGLTIVVNVTGLLPSYATLSSNGNGYIGSIDNGVVTFSNVNILNGCVITLDDIN